VTRLDAREAYPVPVWLLLAAALWGLGYAVCEVIEWADAQAQGVR
jgi:hypothetical protein